jgi:hypothetical protein
VGFLGQEVHEISAIDDHLKIIQNCLYIYTHTHTLLIATYAGVLYGSKKIQTTLKTPKE